MARSLRAVGVCGLLGLFGSAGCDVLTGTCGEDLASEATQTYRGGSTNDGRYVSSGWTGSDLLEFPPGLKLRFEHGLGKVPDSFQAYVSVAREGEGSNIVLATGSQAELIEIDDDALVLQNSTCTDLFILVVAESSP